MTNEISIAENARSILDSITKLWYDGDQNSDPDSEDDNHRNFTDNDKMYSKGIVAESVGLTSTLLLSIAFNNEPDFWNVTDKNCTTPNLLDRVNEIAEISTEYIYGQYVKKGFNAEPEISDDATSGYINKDCGYIESLTMVVSAMTLMRFAQRKGIIRLKDSTKDMVYTLICEGLGSLLSSQHPDGTWGFLADQGSKSSLVFTYYSSATVADVFDYIIGEIGTVDKSIKNPRDGELLDYLDSKLGYNTEEKLIQCRNNVSDWLIKNCLPVLPKLADCGNLPDEVYDQIGAWKQSDDDPDGEYADKNFINLYYAYYLIDMMTICNTDGRFNELVGNMDALREIKNLYSKKMPISEIRYFFGKNDADLENLNKTKLFENLYLGYMEQAIHAARYNFMIACRTGVEFWDSTKAELKLKWEHTDEQINLDCRNVFKSRDSMSLTDPAILPMALRVNACFSYYISQEREYSLKHLYQMIVESMSVSSKGKCEKNTWDRSSYNLRITERCIEAIIDYYDYVNTYEKGKETRAKKEPKTVAAEVRVETVPSEIDAAIEKKINECIDRRLGKAETVSSAPPSEGQIKDAIGAYLNDILLGIESSNDIYYSAKTEDELMLRLLNAHVKMDEQRILMASRRKRNDSYDTDLARGRVKYVTDRINELLDMLLDDVEESEYSLTNLYKRVKGHQ